ncbi:hypothetical protein DMR_01500 [Solidesulfovibrio magneticus RS-1]|uniref:Uncharacterized protein n=1 Tax=Solidesulfovibrio magneticus (strain ATCC 700980 / DSM 13731 / RS-1) TaxID=573370 RepID=C4XTX6_SOLM1|nr:hypothetical protein DMR_01500 [Solidesulfovibrio magneticus RS-1]
MHLHWCYKYFNTRVESLVMSPRTFRHDSRTLLVFRSNRLDDHHAPLPIIKGILPVGQTMLS